MASTVILKKSSVASKIPLSSDLVYGELAVNYTDGKIFFKNASNVINEFLSSSAIGIFTNKTIDSPTITGTVTAGGSVGTSGQVLTSTGTGVTWSTVAGGGTSVTVSDTAPTTPTTGSLWWSPTLQIMKIYNGGVWNPAVNIASGAYTFNVNPTYANIIGEGIAGSPPPTVYGSMLAGTIPTITYGSMLSDTIPTATYGNGSASSLNYDFTFASIAGNGSASSLQLNETFTATYGSMLSDTIPTVTYGSMLSDTIPTTSYGNGMSGAINLVKFDGGGANG